MKRIITLVFLHLTLSVFTQTKILPDQEISYGNNNHTSRDFLIVSLKDNEDNIYLLGNTENDFTFNDLKIIKLDKDLNLLWEVEKSFDLGFSYDKIISAKIDSQNNLIVESSAGYDSQNQLFIILKYSSNGELIWEKPLSDLVNRESHLFHSYTSELDDSDQLHIFYQTKDNQYGTFYSSTLNSDGDIIHNQLLSNLLVSGTNIKRYKIIIENGIYHILTIEDIETEPYSKFMVHTITNTTTESHSLNLSKEAIDYFNTPFAETSTIMKKDNSDNLIVVAPNYSQYKDFGILNINPNGNVNYIKYPNETNDRYPLDFGFDSNNNLVILSNNKISTSNNQLKFTVQKYNSTGTLLFEKDVPYTGNMAKIQDSTILLHDSSNQILSFDFDLNQIYSSQLNTVNTYHLEANDIFSIDSNYYLSSYTNDINYSGSDFLSEVDMLIQKTNSINNNKIYRFNGKGTSKVLELREVVVEPDSYKFSLTEKLGPENLKPGFSNSPHQQRFLTLDKENLSILEDKIVPLNDFLITTDYPKSLVTEFISSENIKYEYVLNEDRTKLTLLNEGAIEWERDLNLYIDPNGDDVISDDEIILDYKINPNGDFYIMTYIYGLQSSTIYRFSIENELKTVEFDKPTFVFQPLSNGWLFTMNKIGTITVYSNRFTEINKIESSPYVYSDISEFGFFIKEKHNQILLNKHGDNRVSLYNQYGELQNEYYHIEANLNNSGIEYDNQYIILLEDIGASIYLNNDFSWRRAAIKKFNIDLTNNFQDYSENDDDDDGVKNGLDECQGTTSGEDVDQYGCLKNQTLSNDEFIIGDNNISIYPNPTNGKLVYRNNLRNTSISKIKIFDQIGREIKVYQKNQIDLSNQNNGIYYLSFYLDNNKHVTKTVIKK